MLIESPWMTLEPYPRLNLAHFLEVCGSRFGPRPAAVTPEGKEYSFDDIILWSKKLARFLQDEGISKGDVVGIFSTNIPEYFIAFQGILRAGAVVTPINTLYRDHEVRDQLVDSGAVLLLASRSLLATAQAAVAGLPHVKALCMEELWEWAAEAPPEPRPVEIDPLNDLAVLPYSSGTTGLPKGVILTHYNLTSNIRQALTMGYSTSYSIGLSFLPYYHIYAMTILMNCGFAMGEKQVVMPGFNPEQLLSLIEQHKVTDLFVVPPALLILINNPAFAKYDMSSLRFICSAAAPLPAELGEQSRRAFKCPIAEAYGMSETSPLINIAPPSMISPGFVGPPAADTTEKIVDLTTDEELAPDGVGELLVMGPQVMKGYWNQPLATAETMTDDGWLRTGDIARADERGFIQIVDRKKEMIKYKGHQIAPAELEALLLEHPGVLDAAVIPKRQADGNEIPKAFIVRRPGMTVDESDIEAFVEERVAPYKKVREIEFLDLIPKSLAGKILRRELIERERQKEAASDLTAGGT